MTQLPIRRVCWLALLIGTACFFVNNLALWSAAWAPPPGYQPRWALSNLDIPIYLTWMTLAPEHWLLPNYNAPWRSEDALVSPLVLAAGKLSAAAGISTRAGFQAMHLFFYVLAAAGFVLLLYTFCPTRRQRMAALVGSLAALPLPLIALGWAKLMGQDSPVFWIGLIQFAYDTADGLFRGGLSNSFTLSFGTAANLFGLFFLTRYVRERQQRDLRLLAVTAGLSGFFHPVEMCVIVLAAGATFALEAAKDRQWKRLAWKGGLVAGGGFAGILPHLIQSSRSEWVRDVSRLYVWEASSVLWVPLVFGVPFILAAYLLLMRFRLRTPGDEVLRTWVLASIALLFVPGVPLKLHVFDGFPYVTAILLVRLLAGSQPVMRLLQSRPALVPAAGFAVLAICLPGYVALFRQIWLDGQRAQPELLLNALERTDERPLLEWLKRNAAPTRQLAMGPSEIAPWIATVPMPSLASHDLFGVTYEEQNRFVNDFYAGKLSAGVAAERLREYGVRYLLVPAGSPAVRYVEGQVAVAKSGGWMVYERREAVRPAYPGLAKLRPDLAGSFGLGQLAGQVRQLVAR